MFAMPISGWLMSTAAGHVPTLYGTFEIPFPGIAKSKSLMEVMALTHYVISWCIIALVSIHILAALKHHFVDKDTILKRMMPSRAEK